MQNSASEVQCAHHCSFVSLDLQFCCSSLPSAAWPRSNGRNPRTSAPSATTVGKDGRSKIKKGHYTTILMLIYLSQVLTQDIIFDELQRFTCSHCRSNGEMSGLTRDSTREVSWQMSIPTSELSLLSFQGDKPTHLWNLRTNCHLCLGPKDMRRAKLWNSKSAATF